MFLESQDFTPSTRSSSSESTSESPSLPEEPVRVEESKRSAWGSEVLGAGEMKVHRKALNPSSTHCLCTLAWVKPHPMVLLHPWDIICMHIVQSASQGLPEAPQTTPVPAQGALAPSAQHLSLSLHGSGAGDSRAWLWGSRQGTAPETQEISSSGTGKEISGLIL